MSGGEKQRTIHVVMMGTAPGGRGGVSSVAAQFLRHDWESPIELSQIDTHVSGTAVERTGAFLAGYCKLLRLLVLNRGRVDIVHMHMSGNGSFYRKYLVHRLVKRFGKKDIIHLHASRFHSFYQTAGKGVQKRIRRLLLECDRVLVLGSYWEKTILRIEPEARAEILKNSVELPENCSGWNEALYQLVYLGTLIERKGLQDLLQAMSLLRQEKPALAGRVRLVIAGSGEEEAKLRSMAEKLGIAGQIRFAGWIEDKEKKQLLQSSQCMVLPSYDEGLPIAILEALSYGLPVVSTDVGSVSDAVLDGQNGYLVSAHAPEQIATAIADIFENQARWERLSRQARKTAETQFDERLMFQRLEQLYLKMMEEEVGCV